MSKLNGSSRLGAILLTLIGVLVFSSSANAASTGCLPGELKAKLNQIKSKFGPIRVISTHRPGARIAGSGRRSLHASCRAVDFHPPKGKHKEVVAWLKANHSGGVGTYSGGMHHIHIDNGPRVRFHHAVNSRGVPVGKRYASNSRKRTAAKSGGSRKVQNSRAYAQKSRGQQMSGRMGLGGPSSGRVAGSNWKLNSYQR